MIFPIFAASLIWGYFDTLAVSYICAFTHELAHITAARICKVGISYVEFQPFGVCAKLKSDIIKNPAVEIFIAASGPFTSLILAYIGYVSRVSEYLMYCNLAIAIINLLPALPLDGGRILRATLTLKTGIIPAYNTTIKISKFFIATIIIISVYTILFAKFNFSLIMICVFLLGNLFAEQHNISRSVMREMLCYKEKLKPSDMNKATVLCADKTTPARKILPLLSCNRYYLIHITDKNMGIANLLTEGELLEAIVQKGIRITLGEIHPKNSKNSEQYPP